MRAIWAVYRRELAVYFRSPIAYAVAFAMYLLIGVLFTATLIQVINANVPNQFSQQGQQYPASVVFNATQLFTFLLFLIGPLITMRLLAEENREGTLEVLMTLPMNESAFIIGKYLASWTYYTLLLFIISATQVGLLEWVGNLDYGIVFTSVLGAWLYGAAALALCLIWSAVTEDQIVAAFLGAATILVLFLSETLAIYVDSFNTAGSNAFIGGLSEFFRQIGLNFHYQRGLVQGLIRADDIVYYLLVVVGALFVTIRIVETRRWRG